MSYYKPDRFFWSDVFNSEIDMRLNKIVDLYDYIGEFYDDYPVKMPEEEYVAFRESMLIWCQYPNISLSAGLNLTINKSMYDDYQARTLPILAGSSIRIGFPLICRE